MRVENGLLHWARRRAFVSLTKSFLSGAVGASGGPQRMGEGMRGGPQSQKVETGFQNLCLPQGAEK